MTDSEVLAKAAQILTRRSDELFWCDDSLDLFNREAAIELYRLAGFDVSDSEYGPHPEPISPSEVSKIILMAHANLHNAMKDMNRNFEEFFRDDQLKIETELTIKTPLRFGAS